MNEMLDEPRAQAESDVEEAINAISDPSPRSVPASQLVPPQRQTASKLELQPHDTTHFLSPSSPMPYFESSVEWLEQSALLLKARPTTARIVTKYSILQRHEQKQVKRREKAAERAQSNGQSGEAAAEAQDRKQQPAQPDRPKAVLVLKTYDPASGVCLKYKTNKAAEVGRLVASLEKLARTMAALPDKPDDATMLDAPTAGDQGTTGTSTPNPDAAAAPKPDSKPTQGGGGGGKKKKKGKK